ncbi:Uncharacterized conserved protein [Plasmopara halstedii]|uniref:Uncharacterized conserved protein n=1 Tax=Plasmopara halstedii TaxID=4781 RepID=A0A0P1AC13_PLAHL|nr:Uncharacterized conserved protein [Plasmopara halstedii]CEG38399.1 Uncharacterized conserved protein [Plasmopara halstedii]|eukprot:XP_024574768.1 Uncharacterized conserved protein [Plasmopara halstedii]
MSEGRFQHLLQPIRDLSKNWNIDLATELEEYMDKLETLSISFDPEDGASIASNSEGGNVMNFAEAALLIQGTSVIYSRKVEYLHALVYQTLAHLSKQQDDTQQSHLNGGIDANPIERDEEEVEKSVFLNPLPLYDSLEEAKPTHITLKKSLQDDESEKVQRTRKDGRALNQSKNNIQASLALMGSLVPDDREHGETFKLLSCNLHASGVLLLDEASKKYLQPMNHVAMDQSLAFGETPGRQRGMWINSEGEPPPITTLNFDDIDDENEPVDQFDYHFEDNMNDTASSPHQDIATDELPRNGTLETERQVVTDKVPSVEKDPWTPLDAYDASLSIVRPFRKGRSYPRVPTYKKKKRLIAHSNKDHAVGLEDENEQDGLSDLAFQERFFKHSKQPQWTSWIYTETSSENPLEQTCKRSFCKRLLLVQTCVELWQREAKWRSIMRRLEAREKESAHAILLREQAMEEEERMEKDPITLSTAPARLDSAYDGIGNEDDSDDDMIHDDGIECADLEQGPEMSESLSSFQDQSSALVTYEDICRQHLASFMAGTEKYVRETDLSKQVTEWQEKLTPLLKQQDTRPPFDIHQYGREILSRLQTQQQAKGVTKKRTKKRTRNNDETDAVAFDTLVHGTSSFEVCRLFLASLQLANSGNVALSHAQTAADHDQVPFKMRLLSSTNAYEALQV